MNGFRCLAIVAIASVAACSMPSMQASPERDREAQALLEDIAADRDDTVVAKMSSQNDAADLRTQLPFIKTLVPEGPPHRREPGTGHRRGQWRAARQGRAVSPADGRVETRRPVGLGRHAGRPADTKWQQTGAAGCLFLQCSC